MLVSFIIPLYNGLALTQECLRTLRATLPPGLRHEIILVDDGSTDGTRDWLRSLPPPGRALLNETNLGFAGTCNRGAAAATGKFLIFLNNDLVLLPGWLEPMLSAARSLGYRTGLVGNLQYRVDDGTLDHAGIQVTAAAKLEHLRTVPPGAAKWYEAFAVTAACCLIRRAVFQEAGGFDPAYRNGGEDIDLALTLRARGYRNVVVPGSAVRHHVSAARGPTSARDEANSRRLFQRWPAELAAAVATAWAGAAPLAPTEYLSPATRRMDRRHLAGWRSRPSARAQLLARWQIAREHRRWQALFDAAPRPEPHPTGDLLPCTGFNFDTYYPQTWLEEFGAVVLPPDFPRRNLFVNGHLHPATAGQPESEGALGLRLIVNGGQAHEIFPIAPGNFNFGFDTPFSLPDQPTTVQIQLLGVARTNRLGKLGRQLAGWPIPRAWRDRLAAYRPRILNRRMRLAQIIADDRVVCSFHNGIVF